MFSEKTQQSLDGEEYTLVLLDMDGAFLKNIKTGMPTNEILAMRQDFLTTLKEIPGEKGFASGSNRQDIFLDTYNSERNGSPLSFLLLPEIAQSIDAEFIPFFMPDVERSVPIGTTYEIAQRTGFNAKDASNLKWNKFDETKISFIYSLAQHLITLKGKNRPLVINFYDDRDDILWILKQYFEILSFRLPSNVTLNLYKYEGSRETLYHTLQGSGIDNYPSLQTIIDEVRPLYTTFELEDSAENGLIAYFKGKNIDECLRNYGDATASVLKDEILTINDLTQIAISCNGNVRDIFLESKKHYENKKLEYLNNLRTNHSSQKIADVAGPIDPSEVNPVVAEPIDPSEVNPIVAEPIDPSGVSPIAAVGLAHIQQAPSRVRGTLYSLPISEKENRNRECSVNCKLI